MPTYRVTLERSVTRQVELRQETVLYVEATDDAQALAAAKALRDDSDAVDEHCEGWADIDSSRQASDDVEDRAFDRRLVHCVVARPRYTNATIVQATEILDIRPEVTEDDA